MKLTLSGNYEHSWNKYYDQSYKWVPDGDD